MKKKLFTEIPFLCSGRITLEQLRDKDAPALQKLVDDPDVYRYLPTFLFEKRYPDIHYVIERLYDECFQESIILGVYTEKTFCGLAEMYGWRDSIHKISVGYRLLKEYWGKGIATETLDLMVHYLYDETDIEIITASTMVDNRASAQVLKKNGFALVISGACEDWGYAEPTPADKWIR
ncbi:MAG: GNAT family N-acetyltransferase [Eubacterium sp.]|nr:GNAT family N-acetyltransferase [Eubacterium sp.]